MRDYLRCVPGFLAFAFVLGLIFGDRPKVHAQVLRPQPYVCFAAVDTTYWLPTQQRAFALTGANCPMNGQLWVMEAADANGSLMLTGGPK